MPRSTWTDRLTRWTRLPSAPRARNLPFGRIWRCADCGFGFSDSRPSDAQLRELYRRHGRRGVRVRGARPRADGAPASQNPTALRETGPGRILDIGCASGKIPGGMRRCRLDRGWVSSHAGAFSRKRRQLLPGSARIFPVTLQEADFPESNFDAVTMWDVLEHVPNPGEFLRKAVSLLQPGGLLTGQRPESG